MAKKDLGNMTTGRTDHSEFDKLISPLGWDGAERNDYSPSKTVERAKTGKEGRASQTEWARNERRGG